MDEQPPVEVTSTWSKVARRRESIATVLMGLAAVLTTWCAFESTKWGGIQSIRFNEAAAARVESTRNELAANQMLQVDIATFIAWVQALEGERGQNLKEEARAQPGPYVPDPDRLSGFLFGRFRKDFRPAIQAWIATRPILHADAPPTPFVMPEYRRPELEQSIQLEAQAEEKAKLARQANRNADNYMLTTVIAALAVFFAGLSSKLALPANGFALLGLSLVLLVITGIVLIRLPVTIF